MVIQKKVQAYDMFKRKKIIYFKSFFKKLIMKQVNKNKIQA